MSSIIYLIDKNMSWLAAPNRIEFDTRFLIWRIAHHYFYGT